MTEGESSPWRTVRFLLGIAALVAVLTMSVLVGAFIYEVKRPAPPHAPPARDLSCGSTVAPASAHPTFTAAPDPAVAAGSEWHAMVWTTCGYILLRLYGDRAPTSVASFVSLARADYWSESVCRRATSPLPPITMLQCGDRPAGRGEPLGYRLPAENLEPNRTYVVGDVVMAPGTDKGATAGQFFVVTERFTLSPGTPAYPVIGRVVAGQELAARVASDGSTKGPPADWVRVLDVEVSRLSGS